MRVCLVGLPNSGKSTFFQELTGFFAHVVNYPGSTVESYEKMKGGVTWVDTPGVYSLKGHTDDEKVTLSELARADFLLFVADASQLTRNFSLLNEVLGLKKPTFMVFTMKDLLEKLGVTFSIENWENQSGLPSFWKECFLSQIGDDPESFLRSILSQRGLVTGSRTLPREVHVWIEKELASLQKGVEKWSIRWDRWFLHPFWGLLAFIVSLFLLFFSAFILSAPATELLEFFFDRITSQIQGWGEGWIISLLSSAIQALGGLLIFVPQIFFLFAVMGLLESSGYLARAALWADVLLKKLGLSGRSFVPLLSGFGCAIVGVLATRTIESSGEKRLVRWMLPLLTCSARIPVFVLVIETVFREKASWVKSAALMGLYFISFFISVSSAWVLQRWVIKSVTPSWLALELPWYRLPMIRQVFRQAILKSWEFIIRAGPVIFGLVLVVHFLASWPSTENSILLWLADLVTPIFEPLGVGPEVGFAILSSFVAREVFVSALNLMETWRPGVLPLSPAQGLSILVFFLVSLQCASTVGILVKEGHGWKETLFQWFTYNGLAYLLAVLTYQVSHRFLF